MDFRLPFPEIFIPVPRSIPKQRIPLFTVRNFRHIRRHSFNGQSARSESNVVILKSIPCTAPVCTASEIGIAEVNADVRISGLVCIDRAFRSIDRLCLCFQGKVSDQRETSYIPTDKRHSPAETAVSCASVQEKSLRTT